MLKEPVKTFLAPFIKLKRLNYIHSLGSNACQKRNATFVRNTQVKSQSGAKRAVKHSVQNAQPVVRI